MFRSVRLSLIFLFVLHVVPGAVQPIYIGLDTNPPPSEGSSEAAKRKWFEKGLQAGTTTISLSPIWKDVEKASGKYEFGDLDFQAKLAREHGMAVYLNIRIIDTNNRALPAPYASWKFDDPRLTKRLIDLMHALAPRVDGQVQWISIGNEVDSYFSAHGDEIAAYRRLLDSVMPTVRSS